MSLWTSKRLTAHAERLTGVIAVAVRTREDHLWIMREVEEWHAALGRVWFRFALTLGVVGFVAGAAVGAWLGGP